jgi:hypothetical protein
VQLALEVHPRRVFSLGLILTAMLGRYRRRSILALTLMVAQSFLYNSVFRTFGLIISNFYHVPDEQVGLYLFPFGHRQFLWIAAAGTVGRKKMIAGSFTISGVFLLVTAYMFGAGLLSATTQTIAWCTIFLFSFGCRQFRLPHSKRDISAQNVRWPLPASTRSARPLAAALRPSYSG